MTSWTHARAPWILAAAIWIVYGTAALTEGVMVFHPDSPLTIALFRSFAENVDAAYRGLPFGDELHRAFAVVDTFFAPVFCVAGLGLVRKEDWAILLTLACSLTSLALLTIDLLTDVFGGFGNVLNPWVYGLTIAPYYVVAGSALAYALHHSQHTLQALVPAVEHGDDGQGTDAVGPPSFSRRSVAFLVDGAIALIFAAIGRGGGVLAVTYLVLRDGLWGGQSIGKRACSLRVVPRQSPGRIGYGTSLERNLVFVIPLVNVALSMAVFEGVILYFTADRLRLGDRIAGTVVIRT